MGQFCTRSICNIESGDASFNQLTNRNMDQKLSTNSESVTPNLKSTNSSTMHSLKSTAEEPLTPITPECDVPNAAYTHSTPNTSGDTINTTKHNPSLSSRHVKIPTPSMQEIQHAMNNLHLWAANSEPSVCNEEKEALPTMATFDVSNLVLANPFGSPATSNSNSNPENTKYAIPSIIPNNQSNQSNNSTTNINNINIITSINNPEIVLTALKGINNNSAIDVAAPASIYGDNESSGTMVVHGDDAVAVEQLTLQEEGSSDKKDETNIVFSPPTISDTAIKAPERTDENNSVDVVTGTNSEIVPEIIDTENNENKIPKKRKTVQFGDKVIEHSPINDEEMSDRNDSIWYDNNNKSDGDDINDTNNKHRKSNEMDINTIQRMRLAMYDDTTIQSSSSSSEEEEEDENDNSTPSHKTLFNERSNFKWQKREVKQHQKAMEAEMKKLQMEQEIAEMNKAMTYYRQQSEPTQPY